MNIMKALALVLNTILMWAFGYASAISQIKLRNVMMYPDAFGFQGKTLPLVSSLAVKVLWLWWGIPLAWFAITVIVFMIGRKQPDQMADITQLHTSATLLVGFVMFCFFVAAGIMPFVSVVVGSN